MLNTHKEDTGADVLCQPKRIKIFLFSQILRSGSGWVFFSIYLCAYNKYCIVFIYLCRLSRGKKSHKRSMESEPFSCLHDSLGVWSIEKWKKFWMQGDEYITEPNAKSQLGLWEKKKKPCNLVCIRLSFFHPKLCQSLLPFIL